ncbi:hypothetical protein QWY28_09245 [Nocardioides sp. SOB77]|uniref:Uncharacterized protein n=1 Tax=Nocardioides oceani TaxID=3058369 RepID=A0ABT8FF25_9ACTN|nr:hypothetical protein [Nocardioides oceani]MDN4173125.1 hypothetical protein [Nocardioides oceani]
MAGRDEESLSPVLGDPSGPHWSAHPPEAWSPDDGEPDHTVHGDELRFFWDYGVQVPLWDDHGLLDDDPAWLREALGLGDALVADLAAWGERMGHLDAHPEMRTEEAYAGLDRQARALVERLRAELDARFTVTYEPS